MTDLKQLLKQRIAVALAKKRGDAFPTQEDMTAADAAVDWLYDDEYKGPHDPMVIQQATQLFRDQILPMMRAVTSVYKSVHEMITPAAVEIMGLADAIADRTTDLGDGLETVTAEVNADIDAELAMETPGCDCGHSNEMRMKHAWTCTWRSGIAYG